LLVTVDGIDLILGTLAIVSADVTDGNAPKIGLPQEAAQHVTAAIAYPDGSQRYPFAGCHTATFAKRRAWDNYWYGKADAGLHSSFEKAPPVFIKSFFTHT
jgi:hypothetical protein